MSYQIRISVFDATGCPLNRGTWSEPIMGDLDEVCARLEARGFVLDATDEGFSFSDERSLDRGSFRGERVREITEYRPYVLPELREEPDTPAQPKRYGKPKRSRFMLEYTDFETGLCERINLGPLADAMPALDILAPVAAASPQPRADENVHARRLGRIKQERERRAFALRESHQGGRDGAQQILEHFVPTPADPDRPNGPRAWAQLDTSHPIAAMFRKGSLGKDHAQAYVRYRAAQIWERYFHRAAGIGGGPGFMSETVDGSGDPQAAMVARMEATMERLNVMSAVGMTERRFKDLDSVIGHGNTLTERANATHRTFNAVKKSVFAGLDAVAGYPRWDKLLQGVQVIAAFEERRRA